MQPRYLHTLEVKEVLWVKFLQEISGEASTLNGQVVQVPLLVAFCQNVLLNCFLADQTINVHLPGLPNAVTPVLRLQSAEAAVNHCASDIADML